MSTGDNLFSGAGNAYTQAVRHGAEADGLVDALAPVSSLVKDVTTASFAADVIQESRVQPVLVDFWAPWCGPCKQLQPALERVVQAAAGRVKLVKMNIDEHPSIAGQLGIQSIPAVIAFKDGKPADGFMGAVPESQIRDFVDRVAGKDAAAQIAAALVEAADARAAGDTQTAAEIFDAVLAEQPSNVEAIAGFADILFEADDVDGATALLARVPPGKQDTPALAAVRARMAIAAQAAALGDPAALEKQLADDPDDHQARFDLAMIHNALGKREEAADALLKIVRADRSWKDDGARAQLLQFFEAWGLMDAVTLSTRRKLSSLLFS